MIDLYEIPENLNGFIEKLEGLHDGSVDTIALQAEIEEIFADNQDKIISLASLVKNLEAENKSIDSHLSEIKRKQLKLKEKIKWLKFQILNIMQYHGLNKIRSPLFNVYRQLGGPSVDFDEKKIPNAYLRLTFTPDKVKMIEDLKDGIYIESAKLIQKEHIRIR